MSSSSIWASLSPFSTLDPTSKKTCMTLPGVSATTWTSVAVCTVPLSDSAPWTALSWGFATVTGIFALVSLGAAAEAAVSAFIAEQPRTVAHTMAAMAIAPAAPCLVRCA